MPILASLIAPSSFGTVLGLFEFQFMQNALAAGTIVAVLAATVGWYVVARRQAFAGHTLSVMAFPGGAFAALAGVSVTLGYYAACVLAAFMIALAGRAQGARGAAQESAAIGVVQAAALALGFVALSLYGGVLESLDSLLFGSLLGITRGQVLGLAVVAVVALGLLAAVGRPLWFATVDEALARGSGVPVRALSAGFLVLLGVAVAATVQVTGALLVFALLIAPAATAQRLTARVGLGLSLSVLIALAITWAGLIGSYYTNYPTGFLIPALAICAYGLAQAGGMRKAATGRGGPGAGSGLLEGRADRLGSRAGRAWRRVGIEHLGGGR